MEACDNVSIGCGKTDTDYWKVIEEKKRVWREKQNHPENTDKWRATCGI